MDLNDNELTLTPINGRAGRLIWAVILMESVICEDEYDSDFSRAC